MSISNTKEHQYRITVEEISNEEKPSQTLTFNHRDREDLFKLIDNLKQGSELVPEAATKIGVGLRLLGTEMMKNRKHPLISDFMPHFKNFMITLKNTVKKNIKC